jgi:superfamily II DNA helicase RecQ
MDRLKEKAYVDGQRLVDVFVARSSEVAKEDILETFPKSDSSIRCLIASTAFGMGIDIPDVDLIIHWGVSSTVLNYWQEVGRCGRDGRSGEALMLAVQSTVSDKRMTEDCVRELHKKAVSDNVCIRLSILKALYLECMDDSEMRKVGEKTVCEALCTPSDTCSCEWCKCCSNCRLSCVCRSSQFKV